MGIEDPFGSDAVEDACVHGHCVDEEVEVEGMGRGWGRVKLAGAWKGRGSEALRACAAVGFVLNKEKGRLEGGGGWGETRGMESEEVEECGAIELGEGGGGIGWGMESERVKVEALNSGMVHEEEKGVGGVVQQEVEGEGGGARWERGVPEGTELGENFDVSMAKSECRGGECRKEEVVAGEMVRVRGVWGGEGGRGSYACY